MTAITFVWERLEKRAARMYGGTDWIPHLTQITDDSLTLHDASNRVLARFALKATKAGIRMTKVE